MNYRELNQSAYDRKLRMVIVGAEGLHARVQDVGDDRATIGWGYTFNRANNVAIWRASGIELTDEQWRTLERIDAAPTQERTRVGLTFTRQLSEAESDRLLRASMAEYETPADRLRMPLSDERVALVSLAYNRGVGMLNGIPTRNVPEHPVMVAIRDGNRAEAWFQIRYNAWGSDRLDRQYPNPGSNEPGLRKRRFAEAQVFGLYDDSDNVTPQEARDVYRMYELHRREIDRVEQNFGVTVEGEAAARNRIAQANRDYPQLVAEYGRVQTITEALEPAHIALVSELQHQHPDLTDRLTGDAFATGRIFLDPDRDLQTEDAVSRAHPGDTRTQHAIRREQRNATTQEMDRDHPALLDARRSISGLPVHETASNDLLIAEGGGDLLRGGLGADVMLGGRGHDRYEIDAGDIVKDIDGRGSLVWNRRTLDGGALDPGTGRYRGADGAFLYAVDGTRLTVTNVQGESVRVEGFRNGDLGIYLAPVASRSAVEGAPADRIDPRQPVHPDHGMYRQAERAVHALDASLGRAPDAYSERMAASVLRLAKEHGLERIDHVVLSRQTGHANAGQNVFVVEGAIDHPASRRPHMSTDRAVRTPVEESFRIIDAFERGQQAAVVTEQHEQQARSAPVLQRA